MIKVKIEIEFEPDDIMKKLDKLDSPDSPEKMDENIFLKEIQKYISQR